MNNDYNDREILFVSGEEAQLIRQAEQVDIIAAARSQKAAPKGTINPLITYETEAERAVIGKRMELERKYQLEKDFNVVQYWLHKYRLLISLLPLIL